MEQQYYAPNKEVILRHPSKMVEKWKSENLTRRKHWYREAFINNFSSLINPIYSTFS